VKVAPLFCSVVFLLVIFAMVLLLSMATLNQVVALMPYWTGLTFFSAFFRNFLEKGTVRAADCYNAICKAEV
jgi:hypothetical protein